MAYTTIDDPSAHFQIALWTGNGSTPTITNAGNSDMQPDWLWGKNRTGTADHHYLIDSSRGTNKYVFSNATSAEITNAAISSFNSDGFTLTSDVGLNRNSSTFVGWQWKANGGTTTTNDASSTGVGSIDSVYQANTDAGFSIVTYTGTGSAGTVAHGIGTAPTVIFTKRRDQAEDWAVLHLGQGNDRISRLNTTDASSGLTQSGAWNDTSPTSTVFSLGNGDSTNGSGRTQLAYCFAPIQGYSDFGNYLGNGNADGPFIYTGFKPAWVIIKRADNGGDWAMMDNKRPNEFNVVQNYLKAQETEAENSDDSFNIDILSNGFKVRYTNGNYNADGGSYIYMAFAESPFVSSKGVPTTAR